MPFDHPSIRVVLRSISDPRDLVADELARRLDLVQNTSIWECQESVSGFIFAQREIHICRCVLVGLQVVPQTLL
jgi:hypothetical protein